MVKLIVQKKKRNPKTPGTTTKKVVKVLELFLWHPILVLTYKQEL
jgi:hypothetical protein